MASKLSAGWGDWGTFTLAQFLNAFGRSEELMRIQLEEGTNYYDAVAGLIKEEPAGLRYSDGGWINTALHAFACRTVPHRLEDFTGRANVYNPHRDARAGARPSIPLQGPDVFKPILEGDEDKGHALVVEFDQDALFDLDDLESTKVGARPMLSADAHAVSIVNRFPAYVRVMDVELVRLLERIGFVTHHKVADGKMTVLRSIPFGINLVTFPFEFTATLSTIQVYGLYAVLKATGRALGRAFRMIRNAQTRRVYDVFFNIGALAGGTIPRIHMQVYVRTRLDPLESNELRWEGRLTLKDFAPADTVPLRWDNRSWQAYAPSVRDGKFDIRFELKGENKDFVDLSDVELWDLAEMLVYHSNALDQMWGIAERNIQFLPTGVIFRPFAVDGGHEKIRDERIYGQSVSMFGRRYNDNPVKLQKGIHYRPPLDRRGRERFNRLLDPASPIVRHAAA